MIKRLLLSSVFSLVFISSGFALTTTSGQSGTPCQPGSFNCIVGGYSYDMWLKNSNGTSTSPMGLYAQSPDSQISQYLSTLLNALVNLTIAAAVPNTFSFSVPSYVQVATPSTVYNPKLKNFNSLQSFTSNDLFRLLANTNTTSSIFQMATFNIPLAASTQQVNVFTNTEQDQKQNQPSTNSVDVNSLLLPLQYSKDSLSDAYNFIQFATGIAQMPPAIDMTSLKGKLTDLIQQYPDLQDYITSTRSMAASTSIGLSNFYYLFAERIPQPSVPAQNGTNIPAISSPLQFENYIATRRYTDPNWMQGIQQLANPAELQRQNIYLLRDLLYVEYQRQMIDERILATLSMMQLNSMGMQKQALNQLIQKLQGEQPFSQTSSEKNKYTPK